MSGNWDRQKFLDSLHDEVGLRRDVPVREMFELGFTPEQASEIARKFFSKDSQDIQAANN